MNRAGHRSLFVASAALLGSSFALLGQSSAPVNSSGYTPLQYIPANADNSDSSTPSYTNQHPEMNEDQPAKGTPPASPDAAAADNVSTSLNFQPLTAATRPVTEEPGFAPVVGVPRDYAEPNSNLVKSAGGLPRVYAPGFRLGSFDIRPDISIGNTYNDNIYLTGAGKPHTSDFITSINPSVAGSYSTGGAGDVDGTQVDFFYAPEGLLFSEHGGDSGLNQLFNGSLSHRFSRLRVNLSENYSHTSGGIIQAGDLVTQDVYNTFLDIDYALTAKTSVELASSYVVDAFSSGLGSQEISSIAFLNYEIRPKITISIAPTYTFLQAQDSSNQQTSVGALVRASYAYSEKTSFYGEVGGSERQFSESNLNTAELDYLAGISWAAGPKTSVGLTTSRKTTSSSITANEDYVASDLGLTLRQSLVDRLTVSLTGGYENSQYFSTVSGDNTQSYDYYSISPALAFHPTIWSDISLSYLYRQSLSNNGTNEFVNNQISLFTTVRF